MNLGFTTITFIVFNKLLLSFRTAILGDGGDGVSFLWNFWWVKKSILELVQNPFYSDYMFYPNMMDLHLHTLILGPALMVLPIQIFFGPVISLNACRISPIGRGLLFQVLSFCMLATEPTIRISIY